MQKKWVVTIVLAAALVLPAVARAHDGHAHKVMGTVSSTDGKNVTVKTTDGKTVTVMLDAKTKITQGNNTLEATALKVGDRVVAEGSEDKEVIMATTVKVGAPQAAAKK